MRIAPCLLMMVSLLSSVQCTLKISVIGSEIYHTFPSKEASFGPSVNKGVITGAAYFVDFGCNETSFKDESKVRKKIWVALIARGECPFELKVYNAQTEGAEFVIVYNDKVSDSSSLIKMDSSNRYLKNKITIPSSFVSFETGNTLRNLMIQKEEAKEPFHLSITQSSEASEEKLTRTLTFIVLLLAAAVMAAFMFLAALFYRVYKYNMQRKVDKINGISKKEIEKISLIKLKDDDVTEQNACSICIEDFKAGDTARRLKCAHLFHKKCIDPWFLLNKHCPLCKRDVTQDESERQEKEEAVVFVVVEVADFHQELEATVVDIFGDMSNKCLNEDNTRAKSIQKSGEAEEEGK